MFLLSSKKLEKALAYDLLDEWEKTKYLLFTVALYALNNAPVGLIRPYSGTKPLPINQCFFLGSSVLSVAITLICLKRCFQTNKEIDDRNFIERYTILFVPISIRVFLFTAPIFIVAILISNSIHPKYQDVFNYFAIGTSCISPLIYLVYYHMLNNSLNRFRLELENKTKETIVLESTCILSVASLFLAIFSIMTDMLLHIPIISLSAIVCGHIARRRIRTMENLTGLGVALAGLIIGYIRFATTAVTSIDKFFMQ
jgi:hypothetical protein